MDDSQLPMPHNNFFHYAFSHLSALSRVIPLETLAMTVQKTFPTQIEQGSIADQLLKKGREEGRVEEESKSEVKGEIKLVRALQEILGVEVSDESILQGKSIEELQALTAELRDLIKKRNQVVRLPPLEMAFGQPGHIMFTLACSLIACASS